MAQRTEIEITAKDKTAAAFASVKSGLGSLKSAAGALGLAFGALEILNSFKGTIEVGDQLDKLSQKTGIAVETLAKYRYAAKLADTDLDQLGSSLAKLAKNMSDAAANPATSLANTFRALGVSMEELRSGDTETVFEKITDRLAAAEDGGKKSTLAMQLFGRSGAELTPLINSLRESKTEAEKLGINVSTKFAKEAQQFNDNISRSIAILEQFKIKILSGVLPVLNEFLERLSGAESGDTLLKLRRRTIERLSELDERAKNIGFVEPFVLAERKRLENELNQLDQKLIVKNNEFVKKFQEQANAKTNAGALPDIIDEGRVKEITNFLQQIKKQAAEAQADISDDERQKALDRVQISKDEWLQKASLLHLGLNDQRKFIDEFNNWNEKVTALALKKTATPIEQLAMKWKNTTKELQEAGAGWLEDMSSKLTEFVTTGKLNFKDFAKSILADLVRIQIQKNLSGLFGGSTGAGLISSLGSLLGFAGGGNPPVGTPYIVGENGPEIRIDRTPATIIPNSMLSGGSGTIINQTIQISTGVQQTVRAEVMSLMPQIQESTKRAIAEERRRGGAFATAFG
jgi:lambda family phage tail tape measure protein